MKRTPSKPSRREIFVLTSKEKKTLCFVLAALVLGLATMEYRRRHPIPASQTEENIRGTSSPKAARTPAKQKQPRRSR